MQSNRDNRIELLRFVLMWFITIGHLFAHTNIREEVPFLSFKWIIIWMIQAITVSATNGFVLITGFYNKSTQIKIKKIFKLWFEVFFYSVLISIIFALFNSNYKSSLKDICFSFIPISSKVYWFFTIYILLYCISPFINIGLNNLTKKSHMLLCCILILFTIIKPTIFPFFDQYDETDGMGIISFITLYVIGSYLSNYVTEIKYKEVLLLCLVLFVFLSKIFFEFVINRINIQVGTSLFYHYNSIFQLQIAVLLIYIFKDIKIKKNIMSLINWLSPSVFAIYLLQEHPKVRMLLWKKIISCDLLMNSSKFIFIILIIFVPIIVIILGLVIDKIRIIFNKFIAKTSVGAYIDKRIDNIQMLI